MRIANKEKKKKKKIFVEHECSANCAVEKLVRSSGFNGKTHCTIIKIQMISSNKEKKVKRQRREWKAHDINEKNMANFGHQQAK